MLTANVSVISKCANAKLFPKENEIAAAVSLSMAAPGFYPCSTFSNLLLNWCATQAVHVIVLCRILEKRVGGWGAGGETRPTPVDKCSIHAEVSCMLGRETSANGL